MNDEVPCVEVIMSKSEVPKSFFFSLPILLFLDIYLNRYSISLGTLENGIF